MKNKSEHEKLKEICDIIGHQPKSYIRYGEYYEEMGFWKNFDCNNLIYSIRLDVREIIFTQEFIEKLAGYLFNIYDEDMLKRDNAIYKIMVHLDDPVSYLYKLLGLGNP